MEAAEITCPDCGKLIAPEGEVAEIRRCHCAEEKRRREEAAAAAPAKPEKSCYICGVDLVGKKRLKDHLGRYWCQSCADADERAKKRADELRCPDCGRMFPDHKLIYFQTERVCHTCYKERERALERKIAKHGIETVHKKAEYSKIGWMALIAIGLLALATLFRYLTS